MATNIYLCTHYNPHSPKVDNRNEFNQTKNHSDLNQMKWVNIEHEWKKKHYLHGFHSKDFFLFKKKNRKSSGKCRSKTISRPKFVMISGTYQWIRYDRILSRSGYKMTSNQQILIYFELCLVTCQFRKYSSKLVLWTFFQWAKNVIKKQLCVSLELCFLLFAERTIVESLDYP